MIVPSLVVSLVTTRVSREEVCLNSFEVLNCWLNLVGSCLDDENEFPLRWLQTTQPTSGGAVTANSSCCANCVEPPRPDLPFFGHAGHAYPLDGWRCSSQKRVMSRPIQVRQL